MSSIDYIVEDGPVPRLTMAVVDDFGSRLMSVYVDPLSAEVPKGAVQAYYDALTVKTTLYCDELASNYFNPSTLTYLTEIVNIRKSLFTTLEIVSNLPPEGPQAE